MKQDKISVIEPYSDSLYQPLATLCDKIPSKNGTNTTAVMCFDYYLNGLEQLVEDTPKDLHSYGYLVYPEELTVSLNSYHDLMNYSISRLLYILISLQTAQRYGKLGPWSLRTTVSI